MNIVIIGNGKMASDCIAIISKQKEHVITGVLLEESKNPSPAVLFQTIEQNHLPVFYLNNVNDIGSLNFIQTAQPDWIMNINCYQYLKEPLLAIPKKGTINFHNGPLPQYGGVHISSWPIINGEKSHGVTWHMVNSGIDTGDILSQVHFEISDQMTAAALMVKCIEQGIGLFEEFWLQWIEGVITPKPQVGIRSYYSKKDKAPNGGELDWKLPAKTLHNLIRGLLLFPYPNEFAFAHFFTQGEKWHVIQSDFNEDNSGEISGTILACNPQSFIVQCGHGQLKIKMLATHDLKPIKMSKWTEQYGIQSGSVLGL
ncbi:MAG: hypothetical protein RL062_1577 [Bacteroidota bacterium]